MTIRKMMAINQSQNQSTVELVKVFSDLQEAIEDVCADACTELGNCTGGLLYSPLISNNVS